MTNQDNISRVQLFCLSNSLAEHHLDNIEAKFDIDLERSQKEEIKRKDYYLQFDSDFRIEARKWPNIMKYFIVLKIY